MECNPEIFRTRNKTSLADVVMEIFLAASAVAIIAYVGYTGYKANVDALHNPRYSAASPERFQFKKIDDRVIINYAGKDYVLMHDNKQNRLELLPRE